MKRRKGKRKHKRGETPAAQVVDQHTVENTPASTTVDIVEIQDEIESLGSADLSDAAQQEPENSAAVEIAPRGNEEPVVPPAPRLGADRRVHPRYAFKAAIEVVAGEPGARIKTRVKDLSQQGCYVDTDSPMALGTITEVRISKGAEGFEARERVVYNQPGKGMGLMFTAVEPGHLQTLDAWIVESRETSWLAANRRRSQRVLMRIPVRVSGRVGTAEAIEEETHTVAISAHGAMITLAAPVYRGQRFTLLNVQTRESLECDVVHISKTAAPQVQVGLEFLLPNAAFWRVAFPPTDWTPRHPDAKNR